MTKAVELAQVASTNVSEAFKNRLINGAMGIWQRGTSFTGVGAIVYYADRWCGIQYAGSTSTITQATNIGLSGFQFALRAQRPAASSDLNSINVGQSVESNNCLDLAGQSVTLSFYARAGANFSAASNILLSQITTGTGTDQNIYGTYTGASTTNQNNTISTTWTRFTQTITVPSNATEIGISFNYSPTGTAGASDFYEITGVQLEVGSSATNFETRAYGQELLLCQRYYQAWYPAEQELIYNESSGAVNKFWQLYMPVPMRTAPTATYGAGMIGGAVVGLPGTISALSLTSSSVNRASTRVSMSTTGGSGNLIYHCDTLDGGFVGLSAEI